MSKDEIGSIFKEGCLVGLSISRWGGPRKIPREVLEEKGIDTDWIHSYKRLIDVENLKPINTPVNKAINIIKAYALPFPIRGINFVPKKLITKLDEFLQECQKEFEEAADEFAEKYDTYVKEAREELGELFDPTQYPRNIRNNFSFQWRFFTLDVPSGELGVLSPSQYEAEKEKLRATIVNARDMAVEALRSQLLDIVRNAVTKLKDGESKRFHKSLVKRFQDFFTTFEDKNVFGDKKLEELVEECRIAMEDVEIGDIRNDEEFREELAESLEEVQETIEKSMVRKPSRKIRKRFSSDERVKVNIKVDR